MRFRRRRKGSSPPPTDLPQLRAWLAAADRSTKASVVASLVSALRPFGQLDPLVIDPARFATLSAGAVSAVTSGSDASSVVGELEQLPALVAEEEPEGPGFFALGAVVEVLYAARFAEGDDGAAVHALLRALDVAGFADDELGTDVMTSLLTALCAHAAKPDSEPIPPAVREQLAAQAERLRS